nr:transporter substrate-binding domain-containing protein [uncultured Rhodoferax sp.]
MAAEPTSLRYFPAGTIYEYRWKLLELALTHTQGHQAHPKLQAVAEGATQNRGMEMLLAGDMDVMALGTNEEREGKLLPIKIDMLRGIVGYRLLIIRSADQSRIARMSAADLRKKLTFGLNSQWADVPVMQKNGFTVVTSTSYENLFDMLKAGRFDAFPRGLNEAQRELDARQVRYPELAVEQTKAIFFPFPVYFWVNKNNPTLAARIERGLKLALEDGSFRKLFESYHATEIAALKQAKRQVVWLDNPILPPNNPQPDTRWWWPDGPTLH